MNRLSKLKTIVLSVSTAFFFVGCPDPEQAEMDAHDSRIQFEPLNANKGLDLFFVPEGKHPKIERFFVVNLDRSKDRLEKMRKEFAKNEISFERFPAVYGKDLSPDERKEVYQYDQRYLVRGLADGEMGNYLSHHRVVKEIANRNYQVAAVMEDDVILHPDRFVERLNSLLAHLPASWDLIYLGCGAHDRAPPKDMKGYGRNTGDVIDCSPERLSTVSNGRLTKLDSHCLAGNYGYMVSAQGAAKLAANMLPMSMPTDYAWKDLFVAGTFGQFEAYCANPELVYADYGMQSTINEGGKPRTETPPPSKN